MSSSKVQKPPVVGSRNLQPWPTIPNLINCGNRLRQLLEEEEVAVVTEKIDGSNLCVHSTGIIATRRTVLGIPNDAEELSKLKFNGLSLEPLGQPLAAAKKIQTDFAEKAFPNLSPHVVVYGEVVQKGTASSKEDKFGYGGRGFKPGHFYAFGLGVHFWEQLNEAEADNAVTVLTDLGFSARRCGTDKSHFLVCILNNRLAGLFKDHDLESIPRKTMKLQDVFPAYKDILMREESLEGVVITCPKSNSMFKWKGREETYSPETTEDFYALPALIGDQWPDALAALVQVGNSVVERQAKVSLSKRLESELAASLISAKTKFPALEDLLGAEERTSQKRKQLVEGYVEQIGREMEQDATGERRAEICRAIPTYLKKRFSKYLR